MQCNIIIINLDFFHNSLIVCFHKKAKSAFTNILNGSEFVFFTEISETDKFGAKMDYSVS